MKRLLSVLLVLFVVFGFVACGNDNPSPTSSSYSSVKPDANIEQEIGNVLGALFEVMPSPSPDNPNNEYWNEKMTEMVKDYSAKNGYILLKGTGLVPSSNNTDTVTGPDMTSSTKGTILYKTSKESSDARTMTVDVVYVSHYDGDNSTFSVEKFDVTYEGKTYDMSQSSYLPSFGPQN